MIDHIRRYRRHSMIGDRAHVVLRAGTASDGKAVHETLPALPAGETGRWRLLGSPALADGCAEGDVLRVEPDGEFDVLSRGGNVCLRVYDPQRRLTASAADLRGSIGRLGGSVEAHPDGRWLVITVPVTAGFPTIEATLADWIERDDLVWEYGNVYDETGEPLGWWAD